MGHSCTDVTKKARLAVVVGVRLCYVSHSADFMLASTAKQQLVKRITAVQRFSHPSQLYQCNVREQGELCI